MRGVRVLAGLVLVVAGATGCGGGSDGEDAAGSEPSAETTVAAGASEDDFCAAYTAFDEGGDATADADEAAEFVQANGAELVETGLPAGAPDAAREGLESLEAFLEDLPDDATGDDLSAVVDAQSEADEQAQDAYTDYGEDLCGVGDDATDDASEPAESATPEPSESATPAATGTTVGEFCAVMSEVSDNIEGLDDEALAGVMGAQLQYVATVGLPDEAPQDAKLGLEVLLSTYAGLGDAPTNDDLAAAYQALTPEEQAQQEALGTYTDETCPAA